MSDNKFFPLVSIVIPTYNYANYLSRALQSILDQTYENWEVIVIDNHSTDDTSKVINRYKDPRIKYLKISNYGVIAKSRNVGILAAKGQWIAFLDSDDWWVADKLRTCAEHFNKQVDLIYHDLEIMRSKRQFFKRKLVKTRKLKKSVLIDLLVNGNAFGNSSVIVRKKMLEKIGLIEESKDLVAVEDYNTWLKIANLTDQFLYLPKRLGYYFIHDQNISKKDISLPIRQATYKFLSILDNKKKIKLESNIRYLSGRFHYLNINYKNAKKDLLFALCNGTFSLRLKSLLMILKIILR
jgi:glycosyltransferase involved in cell wall biosynthesis